MRPDPCEPVMKICPCGISCTICRFYIHGQCQSQYRIGKDSGPLDEAARSPCPVMQCASVHNIAFCARDCLDFPCLLLERTIPYRWSQLAALSSNESIPDQRPSGSLKMPTAHWGAGQASDMLRVFCLGQFRVFRGSVELQDHHWGNGKGPTRKIKALFAFLLCRKDQGARKETLTDLLWSRQTNPKRASSSFHQALFHLRRALEPDLETGPASSYIRRQGERYYFDPQKPCWIDADAFAFFANRAQALEQDGDSAAAVVYWGKAIALYGGEFMAGIDARYRRSEFHDWCAPRYYHFEQLFLAAKMALARHHLALRHHNLAIEHAREALCVEPAFESAHCLLIQCLLEAGQLDSALCQYRVCEAELALRQNRAPSDQTRLLYQELVESIRSG